MKTPLTSWFNARLAEARGSKSRKSRGRKRSNPSAQLNGVQSEIRIENLEERVLLSADFKQAATSLLGAASSFHSTTFPDMEAKQLTGKPAAWTLTSNRQTLGTNAGVIISPNLPFPKLPRASFPTPAPTYVAPNGVVADAASQTWSINDGYVYIKNPAHRSGGPYFYLVPSFPAPGGGPFRLRFETAEPTNDFHYISGDRIDHVTGAFLKGDGFPSKPLSDDSVETALNDLLTKLEMQGRVDVSSGGNVAEQLLANPQQPSPFIDFLVTPEYPYWRETPRSLYTISRNDPAKLTTILEAGPPKYLQIGNLASTPAIGKGGDITSIPNPVTLWLDNAPEFTPRSTMVVMQQLDLTTFGGRTHSSVQIPVIAMTGSISTRLIEGLFNPVHPNNASYRYGAFYDGGTELATSASGYRITDIGGDYVLNARRDSSGQALPIAGFKYLGLDFTVSDGEKFVLRSADRNQDRLYFESKADTVLATANFEGGEVTVRFRKSGNKPALRVELDGAGLVDISDSVEFISADVGGYTLYPQSGVQLSTTPFAFMDVTRPGDTIKAVNSVDNIDRIIDGDSSTKAFFKTRQNGGLVVTPASGQSVVNMLKVTTGAVTFRSLYPAGYKLEGASSPNGPWKLITSGDMNSPATDGEVQTFSFANSTAFTAYKLSFRALYGEYEIAEVELLSRPTQGDLTLSLTNAKISSESVNSALPQDFANVRQDLNIPDSAASTLNDNSIHISTASGFQQAFRLTNSRETNPEARMADYSARLQSELRTFLKTATADKLPSNIASLNAVQRATLADSITVEVVRAVPGRVGFGVSNLPAEVKLVSGFSEWHLNGHPLKTNTGVVRNPVRLTIASATFTIRNGELMPISDVKASEIEMGQTVIGGDGSFSTTWKPFPLQNGALVSLSYYARNVFDGSLLVVPGNSFGIYGNQVPVELPTVTGVTIGGAGKLADLGDESRPGIIITNGDFERMRFPISEVKVGHEVFPSVAVGSATGLTLNSFPARGLKPQRYAVEGGTIVKSPGGLIHSDLKAVFGGNGTAGLEMFPDSNSYKISYGLVSEFLLGNGLLVQAAGAKVEQDNNKRMILRGGAFIDLNPSSPHVLDQVNAGTAKPKGTLVRGRFSLDYTTPLPENVLSSQSLIFYVTDPKVTDHRQQGLQIADYTLTGRNPSQNPLRLTIGASNEILQGAFSAEAGGGELNGVLEPLTLTGGKLPTTTPTVDLTPVPGEASGYLANGVLFNGAGRVLLTPELKLNFTDASYNGTVLAGGPSTGGTSVLVDVTAPGDPIVTVGGNVAFGEGPERAIDDKADGSFKYANDGKANSGLIVTPKLGATVVQALRVSTGSDAPERDPMSYKLEGGNNPNGPFTLISEGALALPNTRSAVGPTVSFSNSVAYTSYRLTFPTLRNAATANAMQVGEVELLGVAAPVLADVTSPRDQVTVFGGSAPSSEGPGAAIDKVAATKYLNFGGKGTGLEITLTGGPKIISGIAVQTANDAPERDPMRYRIEGKDTNGNFVLISEGDLASPIQRHTWTSTITFTNTTAYSTYRVTFPQLRSAGGLFAPKHALQMSEVALFGASAPGVSAASVTIRGRHLESASLMSTSPTQIGDFQFQKLEMTLDTKAVPAAWNLVGPATYFGKSYNIGTPGPDNPRVQIGGSSAGAQLRLANLPVPTVLPSFPAPDVIRVAGLSFDLAKLAKGAVKEIAGVSKTYTYTTPDYPVKLGTTELALSGEVTFTVSASGVKIDSFSGTVKQNTEIKLGNATIQVKSLSIAYDVNGQQIKINGEAMFKFMGAGSNVEMTIRLGDATTPGLVIKDGAVESFKASIDGSFQILKLSAQANGLTVEYSKAENEFKIYGGISLSTQTQSGFKLLDNLSVTLGNENAPGILIKGGVLERLDFEINGNINIFSITASPKNLRVQYDRSTDMLQFTGEVAVTLAPKLTVTAGLPGDGLMINTRTGLVELRGLSLRADADLKFGVLTIKGLHVDYENSGGNVSISAGAEVELPSGLSVGGNFKIVNGKLDSIGIVFERNPGILVAKVINIYRLEVQVEGLSDLNNFKLTGSVYATVGPKVKFAGKSFAYSDIKGTIEITPTYLRIKGQADFVGGLYGSGSFDGKLDWSGTTTVTFSGEVSYYRGLVKGSISASIDVLGNVDFKGTLAAAVPNGVPFIGTKPLGQLTVELRVRPHEAPSASYARFEVKLGFGPFTVTGNLKLDFGGTVEFGLGVRFSLTLPWPLPDINWSKNIKGSFKLFDGTRPVIEVLAAASIPGSPHGEIVYNAQTPLPNETIIDLYADHDNTGNDGKLIASGIRYKKGTQKFVWKDMATFAAPGKPIYVYAVIRDGKDATVYSDYSKQFKVATGFVPKLTSPKEVKTGFGEKVDFGKTSERAITITDPRSSHDRKAKLEVTLSAGKGTLDFSRVPPNVIYRGHGTQEMIVEGTAAAITAALKSLIYVPDSAGDAEPDTIEIAVSALPAELAPLVTGKITVHFESLEIYFEGSNAGTDLGGNTLGLEAGTIIAGHYGQTPLDHIKIYSLKSEFLTGAMVKISNFQQGKEFLELPINMAIYSGVEATFDRRTGILTLTGEGRLSDYERALSAVIYESKLLGSKSLEISVLDHSHGKGQVTLPLKVVPGPTPPKLDVGLKGLTFPAGYSAQPVSPLASVKLPAGENIKYVEYAFVSDSFHAGDDVLSFDAAAFNTATGAKLGVTYNNVAGVLTLSGTATLAQWNRALRTVKYKSRGGSSGVPLTEGPRYFRVTAIDDAGESSSRHLVVTVKSVETPNIAPELTLTKSDALLKGLDKMMVLDAGLKLTSDAPKLIEAKVAFTGGYVQGEYELAIGTSWPNVTTEWDPISGALSLHGVATTWEYQDILRSVEVVALLGRRFRGELALRFTANDGLSETESEELVITVQTAPFLQANLDNISDYTKGRERIQVNDGFWIDTDDVLDQATVKFTQGYRKGEDVLVYDPSSTAGTFISDDFDANTGVLTLSGLATALDYEEAFRGVYYRNTRYNPVAGDRVIEFQVESEVSPSNVLDAYIVVTPEIVPPKVTVGSGSTFTEDGAAVKALPGITITALDATAAFGAAESVLYGAEVDVENWVSGEDVLAFVRTSKITINYDASEGRLVLGGKATFAEYQNVLQGITYRNTSQSPTTTTRKIIVHVLESAAGGLKNQKMTTLKVVSKRDPVSLQSGKIETINVITNDGPVRLGLDDVQFTSGALSAGSTAAASLQFKATKLPNDLLGRVLLADGTPVMKGTLYNIGVLRGLRFDPAPEGIGSTSFSFEVVVANRKTGTTESQGFVRTVNINVKGVTTKTSAEAYVTQVYRHLLNRNPSPRAISNLAAQLEAALLRVGRQNGLSDEVAARRSVVDSILRGDAIRAYRINAFYQKRLGRAATSNELAVSGSLGEIRRGLLASEEFYQQNNSNSNASYVAAVYRALLGREPSSAESSLWTGALQSGAARQTFVDSLQTPAMTEDGRQATFRDLLDRKGTYDDLFDFDNTNRGKLIASIAASDEYYARYSTPSTSKRLRTHSTTAYKSVGVVGDLTGGHATGTLIAPQFVLVAAHTVYSLPPGQITFTIGGKTQHIDKLFVHPNFSPDIVGLNSTNDIAILKLRQPVSGITPALLTGVAPKLGDVLNLVGFGQHEGALFGTKREGSTPPVVQVESNIFRWQQLSTVQNDADPGDSGAPIFMTIKGEQYVVGLVSGGTDGSDELGNIGTNTRVDSYLRWIQTITGSLKVNDVAEAPSLQLERDSLVVDMNSPETRIPLMVRAGANVKFTVASSRPDLFRTLSVDQDGSGNGALVFRTAHNARGEARITVTATDAGGTVSRVFRLSARMADGAPTIRTPEAEVHSRRPVINWFAVTNAARYEVEVTRTSQSTRPIVQTRVTGTRWQPDANLPVGQLDIRVRSVNGAGVKSAWSASYALNVVNPLSGTAGRDAFVLAYSGTDVTVTRAVDGGTPENQGTFPLTDPLTFLNLSSNDTVLVNGTSGDDIISRSHTGLSVNKHLSILNGQPKLTLSGGEGSDTYRFDADRQLGVVTLAELSASQGTDTIDFSPTTAAVALNLGLVTDQAVNSKLSLVLGSVSAFETVIGGTGDDKLTGTGYANVLVGNKGKDSLIGGGGRDLLIGGEGLDTISGGGGEDIIIAGRTTSDASTANLAALLTAWQAPTSYSTRVAALRAGVGSPKVSLTRKTNVLNDSGHDDLLSGGAGKDWFLSAIDDVISDLFNGELIDKL